MDRYILLVLVAEGVQENWQY